MFGMPRKKRLMRTHNERSSYPAQGMAVEVSWIFEKEKLKKKKFAKRSD
jgi:hypothetical protein